MLRQGKQEKAVKAAPTVDIRIALSNLERQLRRMGAEHRGKGTDFVAAEVSALHWLTELKRTTEKL
jgi:hypothetical protein